MNEMEHIKCISKKCITGTIAQGNLILPVEGNDVYAAFSAFLSESVHKIEQNPIDSRMDWHIAAIL